MNQRLVNSVLLLFLSVLSFKVLAQEPDVKFGKISLEELKMQVYPKDTFADAVVLYSKGSFDASTFKFTHFTRIKILKPSALDRANFVFDTPSKGDVSGFTYNLSESGEIVKERLKNTSIYIEEIVESYNILKVAMANVKVGSVIDIKFSHFGLPYEWTFQENIPVVWSELRIHSDPRIFSYSKNHFGFETLYINEQNYWVAKDMPAIREEPYMNSIENYRTKFEFNVTQYKSYDGFRRIATDWDAVTRTLDQHQRFGVQLRAGAFLNSIADSIKNSTGTDREKIGSALAHIQKKIRWNNAIRLLATDYLAENYKKSLQGNSADLNLSLIVLLKKLGYEAFPVALSTRDNGFLSPVFPSITKLNHVITYVKAGEEVYFIDASDKYTPLGLLPVRCLNLQGRLIDSKQNKWISLEPRGKFSKKIYARISVAGDLSIEYKLDITHDGYAALEQRANLDDPDYQDSRKNTLASAFDLSVQEYNVLGKDSINGPLREAFIMNQSVEGIGDFILIKPVLGQIFTKNPFFSEERKFPLDLVYPISENYISTLVIPDGYVVETLPKSVAIALPDGAGKFTYKIGKLNNTVQLVSSFDINQYLFTQDQYQHIKQFLELYISQLNSPIVLKKFSHSEPKPAAAEGRIIE